MKFSDNKHTQGILEIFEQINQIPRQSKHEEEISAWLVEWGKTHNFETITDEFMNVLMRVPATPGMENKPTVTLQGHMDMVCVTDLNTVHDFQKDPIEMYIEDGWLKAKGTTLGADDGLALATAMYMATCPEVKHGGLELLFTVDEETGLTGANNLRTDWLKGKYLINLDSEDEGVITIGCAGGEETRLYYSNEYTSATKGFKAHNLKIFNLMGGHSGCSIKEQQANAIHLLDRLLLELDAACGIELMNIQGGIAHNAIPSTANAEIFIAPENIKLAQEIIANCTKTFKAEYATTDSNLEIVLEEVEKAEDTKVLTHETATKIMQVIAVFPYGIYRVSKEIEGLVETSSNLALVKFTEAETEIISSQRSTQMSMLKVLTNKIHFLGSLTGARVENRDPYNAWEPIWSSYLLEKSKVTYNKLFGKEPVVEVIHAGLECGLIGSKYPDYEMISIGATLKDVHSPLERLLISDVEKIFDFVKELLIEL